MNLHTRTIVNNEPKAPLNQSTSKNSPKQKQQSLSHNGENHWADTKIDPENRHPNSSSNPNDLSNARQQRQPPLPHQQHFKLTRTTNPKSAVRKLTLHQEKAIL